MVKIMLGSVDSFDEVVLTASKESMSVKELFAAEAATEGSSVEANLIKPNSTVSVYRENGEVEVIEDINITISELGLENDDAIFVTKNLNGAL